MELQTVNVGDEFETEIVSFGRSQDPMIKADGLVVFVKGTEDMGLKIGDKIKVKVNKVMEKFGFAVLVE